MKYYGLTNIGLLRESNQDTFFSTYNKNNEFMAVVCDGIGGGKAGDVASQIAATFIEEAFLNKPVFNSESEHRDWTLETIRQANEKIYQDSLTSRKKHGMGTTLVGVLIVEDETYVFHMGDSRIYGFYDDIICLTEDHNLAADLIKSGELSEEDALRHPKGKALTNALGIWSQYRVDINKIKKGHRYLLLCSDGLHGYVSESVIKQVVEDNVLSVEEKAQALVSAALKTGGYDNITVIVIDKIGGNNNE
ncbi:MAG: serine/threonine-protein phosphatase [Erysipelotrichia bacterium]|nr:serine/threonine-protein phosphatase [Erysipelotrichia bacterium]NCC53864.1 serine/threonine-protein phosphatase [Erysipelotrichia bacterium]